MFKSKWNFVLALLACTLLLPATVNAKNNPMARPFMMQGNGVVQFTSQTTTIAMEAGTATHLGKYTATGDGTISVVNSIVTVNYDKSIYVAANGDELWVSAIITIISGPPITSNYTFKMEGTIIGGTGRFDGASGEVNTVPIEGYVSSAGIIYSYLATGTITY